jgi:hypothetical protein
MNFFELHFNPQKIDTPDLIFGSFCYEPENVYEKRLGSFFVVGELKNVLPSNKRFLDNLALRLKKNYYSSTAKSSAEAALKNCLKKTNEFLESVAKEGEVSWLGNLNLAVFSIKAEKKDKFEVNFSKVGNVKIVLLRPGQIFDIGKNLEFSEIEPYPLKIFGNIVSGKLAKDDIVVILTSNVFGHFSEQGLLKEIAQITTRQDFAQGLKVLLRNREKELLKITGMCLICQLSPESWTEQKKKAASFTFQKEAEKFSLKNVFLPIIEVITSSLQNKFSYIRNKFVIRKRTFMSRKNLILVSLLLFLLLLGFLIFR